MKKLSLLIVLAFIIQANVSSQSCLPEGISFTTQAQVNSFQINYPNCTEIEGDIEIYGDDITNLNGLNVLTLIGGDLRIWENSALTSLTGFNNLISIEGDVEIESNNALINLNGLGNLTIIGGDLFIAANRVLSSFSGLENLTSIEGNLSIGRPWGSNPSLISLTGLNNLTSIGGGLFIDGGQSITSLTSLDNLTSIGGDLWIWATSVLTSLTGLDNIDAGSIDSLFIFDNISLSNCDVKSICDYLVAPGGSIEIHDNAHGCNNKEEIEEACSAVGVSDQSLEPVISIYPNPAKNDIYISTKNGVKIIYVNIYNQVGQKVLNEYKILSSIDISILDKGIYVIEVLTTESRIKEKLIIR